MAVSNSVKKSAKKTATRARRKAEKLFAIGKIKAKSAGKSISEAASSAWITATSTKRDALRALRASKARAKNGHSAADEWELGSRMLARQADICAYLASCGYDDPRADAAYISRLRECEDVFRGESHWADAAYGSLHELGGFNGGTNMPEMIESKREEALIPLWMWYGSHVMDPETFIVPARPPENGEGAGAFAPVMRVLGNRITFSEVKALPLPELRRLGKCLCELSNNLCGFKEGYYGSKYELPGKDEKWEAGECLPLTRRFRMADSDSDDYWTDAGSGMKRMKTRAELGLDRCAWNADISTVGEFFKVYADWFAPIERGDNFDVAVKTSAPSVRLRTLEEYAWSIDEESARNIEQGLEERKKLYWRWLAMNASALWD